VFTVVVIYDRIVGDGRSRFFASNCVAARVVSAKSGLETPAVVAYRRLILLG
jgi:hypothetical protein